MAILMFAGSGGYHVHAVFQNAGQLVKGDQVQVGGRPIGSITDIGLTDDGQAEVDMKLDEFTPLHRGTTATIRAASLSGIANRYIALSLGPDSNPEIKSGDSIDADRTVAPVDLDQLFNTLDPATRRGLQQFVQGTARQIKGRSAQAAESLKYLNPALSSTSALTQELVTNKVEFERFLTDTSHLVTTIAGRRNDLAQLVGNANTTSRAIGDENVALARALGLLPPTLRRANTTFVNLRATLDDLDPLIRESKRSSRKLAPFLRALRPLVHDARPTIHDLRVLIRRRGANNDLIELTAKTPRLANLASTDFPRTIRTLQRSQPVIEYIRPYAPELTGWLTKFAEGANTYDANGHYARVQPIFNAFQVNDTAAGPQLVAQPNSQRGTGFETGNDLRCPGGATQPSPDGSSPYREPTPGQECDPGQTPPGP